MRMTPNQANILARLVEELRPEWNFPGIRAAIESVNARRSAYDVAHAMLTTTADPNAQTPAAIRNPHYWPGVTTEPTRQPARYVADEPAEIVDEATRAAYMAKIRKTVSQS